MEDFCFGFCAVTFWCLHLLCLDFDGVGRELCYPVAFQVSEINFNYRVNCRK